MVIRDSLGEYLMTGFRCHCRLWWPIKFWKRLPVAAALEHRWQDPWKYEKQLWEAKRSLPRTGWGFPIEKGGD